MPDCATGGRRCASGSPSVTGKRRLFAFGTAYALARGRDGEGDAGEVADVAADTYDGCALYCCFSFCSCDPPPHDVEDVTYICDAGDIDGGCPEPDTSSYAVCEGICPMTSQYPYYGGPLQSCRV